MAVIGIDLGTSNSAAAVLRGGRPVMIPSGDGISLGGNAFPSYGQPGRGDLYVTVAVHVPEHPTDHERHLYEQLRQLGSTGPLTGSGPESHDLGP